MKIKRFIFAFFLFIPAVILFSCAPVLDRSLMREGERDVSFRALRENPEAYKGRLYLLGGVTVRARLIPEGSELEAMHVPVDRYGHFEDRGRTQGRFLAVMPSEQGFMDPEVFTKGRRLTIAAEFTGVRRDKIDEMDYSYPVFEIRQFYLWPRRTAYYPAYYYDPWFYPYSYYYWNPWWNYPYYNYYYDYYRTGPPVYRRSPPPAPPPASQSPLFQRPERPGLPRPGRQ